MLSALIKITEALFMFTRTFFNWTICHLPQLAYWPTVASKVASSHQSY